MLSKEIQIMVDVKKAEKDFLQQASISIPQPLSNLIPPIIYKGLFVY